MIDSIPGGLGQFLWSDAIVRHRVAVFSVKRFCLLTFFVLDFLIRSLRVATFHVCHLEVERKPVGRDNFLV